MSILQSMLADLAVESGIMEQQASPDEITIVTSETVTQLEDEVSELSDKISDSNAELDQVLEASDAIVSTEALLADRINFLRNPAQAAAYNSVTQAMNWSGVIESMEGYKFPKALYDNVVGTPSFEAEEGQDGSAQAGKDVEKKDGLIKKFLAMLANAAKAAKALFVRFLDLFRTSNEKNGRSVAILEKAMGEREGVAKSDKIKGTGYRDLVVNGTVDPVQALKLIEEGYNTHLKGTQAKIDAVVLEVADLLKRGTVEGFSRALDAVLKKVGARGENTATAALVLTTFLDRFPESFEYKLGGDRTAAFAITRKSTGAPTVAFTISAIKADAPAEVAVPSLGDVGGIVAALKKQHAFIDEINKAITANIAVSEKVLSEAETAAKKPGATKEDEAPLRAVVGAAQAVMNISKVFLPKYNQLALTTAHSSFKFGMAVVNQYPKKGAAKAAE